MCLARKLSSIFQRVNHDLKSEAIRSWWFLLPNHRPNTRKKGAETASVLAFQSCPPVDLGMSWEDSSSKMGILWLVQTGFPAS